jgi:hypothetical protein
MAYTVKMFAHAPLKAYTGLLDWDTNAIKVALFTSTYVPSQANDTLYSALSNEVSGSAPGYSTGGVALANKTNTVSSLTTTLDADDSSWTTATFTARVAVVYDTVTSALLGYIDFGADQSVVVGTFTIQWSGSGIATIAVS